MSEFFKSLCGFWRRANTPDLLEMESGLDPQTAELEISALMFGYGIS